MNVDVQQSTFSGWAIVEVFGHQKYAGFVTTEAYGQAVLIRVEVPPLDARDRVTKHYEYLEDRRVPPGSTVREAAVPGYTKLFGAGAIYSITPCTEQVAIEAIDALRSRALTLVALPPAALTAGPLVDAEVDDDDDGGFVGRDDAEESVG